jgi:LysM repeat protein
MKRIVLIIVLIATALTAGAQQFTSYRNTVPDAYNFWVYTPDGYENTYEVKPVILFLHGASLCGSDLNRVMRYGPLDALKRGLHIDAVIIAPQNPGGAWKPSKLMKIIEWVEEHYVVDTDRLYVLGMSLGGYGTLDFTGTYPDKVAAAMALCGGANLRNGYCGLNDVPLWILHGTADRQVGLKESQKVVNAMERCGSTDRLIFTKLPGVNHGGPAHAFYISDTYDWLFEHRLSDPGRPVNESYTITPESFHNVYRKLTPRKIPVASSSSKGNAKASPALSDNDSQSNDTKPVAKNSMPNNGDPVYHTIRKGDTLGHIAARYHTTVNKICQLNNIRSTTVLQIGKKLRVK